MPNYSARYKIAGVKDFESDLGTEHPTRCQEFSTYEFSAINFEIATEEANRHTPAISKGFMDPEITLDSLVEK